MNDTQHTYWSGYLRDLANMLGLKDWRVTLGRECDNDLEALGTSYPASEYKSVFIRLGMDFWNQTPEEQRWVCVHELLHPHFHRAHDLVKIASEKFDENSLMQELPNLHNREIEMGVDGIAMAIAERFPLPEAS